MSITPFHLTAARLRFRMNLNGPGGAAAGEAERWTAHVVTRENDHESE